MLRVICFSKDRPLQLQSYIESLMHYSGLPPEYITVLHAASPGISYEQLIEKFPQIDWVAERSYRDDLLDAVIRAEEDYILFGCDDVVFKEYFDLNTCIRHMERDSDLFGFSLRMGANINFLPELSPRDDVLTWHWADARNNYWRYCWEVSASVYRRSFVLDYLKSRDDLTNPNRFEAYLAADIEAGKTRVPPKLACFPESRCVTITVNRVQDEFPNEFDESGDNDALTLFRQYEAGLRHDWPKIAHWRNNSVHVGAEAFDLVKQYDPPANQYELSTREVGREASLPGNLKLKIFVWRFATRQWEFARKILPRPALRVVTHIAKRVRQL